MQVTNYLYHKILESVVSDKWPKHSMFEINCQGEITNYKFDALPIERTSQIICKREHTGFHNNILGSYDNSPIGAFSNHKLCIKVYNSSLNDTWNTEKTQ